MPTAQEIFNTYLTDTKSDDLYTSKLSKLQDRTASKQAKLPPHTPDNLIGMPDADSFITTNLGNTRNISPDGTWYDAVEIKHGNHPYDMQGIDKQANPNVIGKSVRSMQLQRELVARRLNKPIEAVTEQDMIDVGSQQQIQKLADIVQEKGADRWEAPLIRGVEQANLTGDYVDEFGNPIAIPLDIPINSRATKQIGNRTGADFVNPNTRVNVTLQAAHDPLMNTTPNKKSYIDESPSDKYARLFGKSNAGRGSQDIAMAQGAIAKFGADTLNMLTNLIGKDNIASYDKWAGEVEKSLGGDGKVGIFIGEDGKFNNAEEGDKIQSIFDYRDLETAQKDFGVSETTLQEHNAAMSKSLKQWEEAESVTDYIASLATGMSQLDRILAGSAGEIAALSIPGGASLVAATRTSNYAEEYEKNNGKEMSAAKLAQTFFTEVAVLIPEKLLIKAGVGKLYNKVLGKKGDSLPKTIKQKVKDTTLGVAGAGVAEGLQEYGEGISEVVATQKEGDKTLAEIAADASTVHGAAIGFGMGAGLKGGAEIAGSAAVGAKEAVIKGKAKLAKDNASKVPENDPESPATEEELQDVGVKFKDIITKLNENKAVSREDLDEIASIQEIVDRHPDKKKREANQAKIHEARQMLAARLEETDLDSDPILFGSSEDAIGDTLEYIDNVLDGVDGKPSATLEAKLAKVAKDNGVDEESFKVTKDIWAVEIDVTRSKRGYKTQEAVLKSLLRSPEPDKVQIEALVGRMQNLSRTQKNYADVLTANITDVQTELDEYNEDKTGLIKTDGNYKKLKKQRHIDIDHGTSISKFTMNIADVAGKLQVSDSAYKILELKIGNHKYIDNALAKQASKIKDVGLTVTDTGIDTAIKIDSSHLTGTKRNQAVIDKKFYSKHSINKVIAPEDSKRWDVKDYGKDNLDVLNRNEYTKDDTVLLSLDKGTKKEGIGKLFATGKLASTLNKAVKAGATIVLDTAIPYSHAKGASVRDLVKKQLTGFKRDYEEVLNITTKDKKQKVEGTGVFKPKADVAKHNEDIIASVTKYNEETITDAVDLDKAVTSFIDGKSEIKDHKDLIKKKFKGKTDADKIQAFKNYTDRKFNALVESVITDKAKLEEVLAKKSSITTNLEKELTTKLKETSPIVMKEADKRIKKAKKAKKEASTILQDYKKAKASSEVEAEEVLAKSSLEDHAVMDSLLENTVSNYSYTNRGTEYTTARFYNKKDKAGATKVITGLGGAKVAEGQEMSTIQEIRLGDIIEVGNPNFLNSLPVTDMDSDVQDYVKAYTKFIKATLATTSKLKDPKDARKYMFKLADDPARGLVFESIDGKDVVNKNVALAMKLTMDEMIAYNGKLLDSGYKNDNDIAQMFGIDSTQVTNKIRNGIADKGMLKKTLANSLGKAALSKMGIVPRKQDIDSDLFNKLAADFGNMMVLVAEKEGTLTRTEMKANEYAKMMEKTATGNGNADIYFVKFAETDIKVVSDDITDTREAYEKIHELVADDSTFRVGPHSSSVTNSHRANKVAKSKAGFTTSDEIEERMEELRASKWSMDTALIKRIVAGDQKVLLKWLGHTEDTSQMSEYDASTQVGKNRDILKSVEELEKISQVEDDAEASDLYFDWFYSSNGRYMMDSNTVNPQTDKLHRFLIQPAATFLNYTVKNGKLLVGKQDVTKEFKYAIAQAFGFAVDKEHSNDMYEVGRQLMEMDVKDIAEKLDNVENLEVVINGETITLKIEHISHAYQALDALEKTHKGSPFVSSLTAETDAVTSGFALKLLQMPIISNLWTWLNKVGVFRKQDLLIHGKNGHSMNDILSASGFFDSYQTLAKDSKIELKDVEVGHAAIKYNKVDFREKDWATIRDVLPAFDDTVGVVSSQLRSLFKDPFMTFNYSAGMTSIRRSLTNKITNGLVTDMIKSNKGSPAHVLLKDIAKKAGIKTGEMRKMLNAKRLSTIRLESLDYNEDSSKKPDYLLLEDYLNEYIQASYGYKIEELMTKNFEPFIEAQTQINNAFKAMFVLFDKEYKEKVAEVLAANQRVTTADKLEIINGLRHKFPAIAGPKSDKVNKSDYVGIFKIGNATPNSTENRLKPSQTYKSNGESDVVRHEVKVFEEAISAGSVVPIHYIDGAIMAELIGETKGGLTAIHDAIMMPLTEMVSGAKKYNEKYLQISMEYSFIEKIQDQLYSATKDFTDESPLFEETHTKGKTKEEDVSKGQLVANAIEGFRDLSMLVKNERKAVEDALNVGSSVAHMASIAEGVYYHEMTGTDGQSESRKVGKKPQTVSKGKSASEDVKSPSVEDIDKLKASDTHKLPKVILSPEELTTITKANEETIKEHKLTVGTGAEYAYDVNTQIITRSTNADITEEQHQVYLAHEIRHALTYKWLSDNKNSAEFKYIVKALDKIKKDFVPTEDANDALLFNRLLHATSQKGDLGRVAEIVAILSAEPHIRKQFMKHFPQVSRSKLTKLLDTIKKYLGIHGDTKYMTAIIDSIVDNGAKGRVSENSVLGASSFDSLSTAQIMALKTLYKAADVGSRNIMGTNKDSDTMSLQDHLFSKRAIKEAKALIEEEAKKCKGK